MPATRTVVYKIAKLHPDQVERYQQLHDEIPMENERHMQESGIISLRIFGSGLTLFMIVETDSALETPDRFIDLAAEQRWHDLTGICFSEKWEDMKEVYTFMRSDD